MARAQGRRGSGLSRPQWILLGGVAALVVVVAVGLGIWLSTRDDSTTTVPTLSHVAYARLWNATVIGTPQATVLAKWPEPYQVYPDNFKNDCFEWWDKPQHLYNLCFKEGVLVAKSIA